MAEGLRKGPSGPPNGWGKLFRGLGWFLLHRGRDRYFGISSWANLLITTSRMSLRFLAASSMASRDP